MWRRTVWYIGTDVLKKPASYNCRAVSIYIPQAETEYWAETSLANGTKLVINSSQG
jgi:hypothetical protein